MSARSRYLAESGACLLAILLILALPQIGALDEWAQSFFFDSAAGTWLLPPDHRGPLFILLYKAPKILMVAGTSIIMMALLAAHWKSRPLRQSRSLWNAVAVMALVPLIAGLLKNMTGVSCPVQELQYGGHYAAVTIWDRLAMPELSAEHFQCWPAGHAAGGFALLGIRCLAPGLSPASRLAPLRGFFWMPGMVMGWSMGLFQMARGQHYLSHTIVTMLLAWVITSLMLYGRATHKPARNQQQVF